MFRRKQLGVALVAAIFMVVVLSLLGGFMIRISGVQRTTVSIALNSARVYYAARSGLEWGLYNAAAVNPKADFTQTFNVTAADGFSSNTVVVGTYQNPPPTEGAETIHIYTITSTSNFGASGTLDYTTREIEATTSIRE